MFGYVKVDSGELKGKYNELYKAFYCGLCRSMKKNVSWLYTSTLNYDFVFLCISLIIYLGMSLIVHYVFNRLNIVFQNVVSGKAFLK